MFMDFGSFLSGMRLSRQEIEDQKKAELNRRYMEEQMTTMQLGRDLTAEQLARERFANQNAPGEKKYLDFQRREPYRMRQLAGAYAAEGATPESLNALAEERDAELASYGMPTVGIRARPGKKDGTWDLVSTDGRSVAVGMSAEDATRQHAALFGVPWGGEKRVDREAAERRARGGAGGAAGSMTKNPGLDQLVPLQKAALANYQQAQRIATDTQLMEDLGYTKEEALANLNTAAEEFNYWNSQLASANAIMDKGTGKTFPGIKPPPARPPKAAPAKPPESEVRKVRGGLEVWTDTGGKYGAAGKQWTKDPKTGAWYGATKSDILGAPAAPAQSVLSNGKPKPSIFTN